MKIYKKIVLNQKGEVIKSKSFEYKGKIAKCKGGGTTTHVDTEYNDRMATIAEKQQGWADEYANWHKGKNADGTDIQYGEGEGSYKDMEQAQINSNLQLIPKETKFKTDVLGAKTDVLGGLSSSLGSLSNEKSKAKSDVNIAFDNSMGQQKRDMARMGLSPNDNSFGALLGAGSLERAKALGFAGSKAEETQRKKLLQNAQVLGGIT